MCFNISSRHIHYYFHFLQVGTWNLNWNGIRTPKWFEEHEQQIDLLFALTFKLHGKKKTLYWGLATMKQSLCMQHIEMWTKFVIVSLLVFDHWWLTQWYTNCLNNYKKIITMVLCIETSCSWRNMPLEVFRFSYLIVALLSYK